MCSLRLVCIQWRRFNDEQAAYQHHICASRPAGHARAAGRDGLADALRIDDSRFRLHPYLQTKTGGFVLVKMTKGV